MCTQQRCSHCNSLTRKQIIQQPSSRWGVPRPSQKHPAASSLSASSNIFWYSSADWTSQVTSHQVTDEQGDISESDTQQQQHFPIFAIFFCGWVTPDVCAKQQQYRENVLIHDKTKKHQTSCKTLLEKTFLQLNSLKHHKRFIGKNVKTFCRVVCSNASLPSAASHWSMKYKVFESLNTKQFKTCVFIVSESELKTFKKFW